MLKTHQIAAFQKMLSGKHAPEPPNRRLATPHVAILGDALVESTLADS